MNNGTSAFDRSAPDYIQAVIAKKPHAQDPKDIRIRQIIEHDFLQDEWAKAAFNTIHHQQIDYLQDAIANVDRPGHVSDATQNVLKSIAGELHSTIEEGGEQLENIPSGTPVLIMTNHLGTYKLDGINPQRDLGDNVPRYDGYDFMYPYPLYFAALQPVAEALSNNLSYTSDDFPGVFGQIHSEAGFVYVPPATMMTGGRTEALIEQTRQVIRQIPNTALVNFPEGGTSGKYNEAGPYDLLDFKTGGYVVAAELGMTILPVAQYFDPHEGMKLKVFEPINMVPADREHYQDLAARHQHEMQQWLNSKQQGETFRAAA